MKQRSALFAGLTCGLALNAAAPAQAQAQAQRQGTVSWQKIIVEKKFRSEGVAVADVNRDGKTDILVGDFWYEAPTWKAHEVRPPGDFGDGAHSYSTSFCCFSDDYNGDGWADLLVVGFPGAPSYWYENPRNAAGHWKQRLVSDSSCNETPIYVDLFGDGRRRLVMATQPQGQMFWFSVPADLEKPWERHPISAPSTPQAKMPGTDQFSHGLGAGDIDGDNRADVLVKGGWWQQPPDAQNAAAPWTFHPADLGEDCANMHALDLDGDKLPDVLSSSAHAKGLWWHKQPPGAGGGQWTHNVLLNDFSQSHALNFIDINGDGQKDLVTGKRWWAHGPEGDVDPNAPAVLYWIEIKRGAAPALIRHEIDTDSGIGTQFTTADLNGDTLPDIVTANKKGVFAFVQVRR